MGLFDKLKKALTKTREAITDKLAAVFTPGRKLDRALLQELEDVLLSADVGLETTDFLIEQLKEAGRMAGPDADADALLREQVVKLLKEAEGEGPKFGAPHVILIVGVNGTGKTTSIGKLGKHLTTNEGKSVIYAAADTFRAAAIDQLKIWGERSNIPVIAGEPNGDSAAVAVDALQAAQSRGTDVLIVDTAGRLHNKSNLMQELEKVSRVLNKRSPGAPHEVLMVLDATTGQNGLNQAREFVKTAGVTGLILTKIDGTAKGGVALAIAKTMSLPIRYVGFGEAVDDFDVFDAEKFAMSLLGERAEAQAS
ncbi:MAG: signal recognition particle-docking protein FtsY [Calditrichaeota bacterium]|nr:signal recognition particle-docking protein FtsY [Calditrichota bacterium]MCB9368706.1 signal recognition particle-docking protein FtsY [Calditrichota bacterium]